jgi:biopolymer transport protein ExbD
MMDGTATTDAALARKLAAAVKRNVLLEVKLAYAEKARPRAQAVEAIVKRAGIELSSVTAVPSQVAPAITKLVIAANGSLTLDARSVTDAQLDTELAALGKRTKQLALTADKATPYAVIVKLMDRAKAAGLTEIIFVAAP